ncbi:winged helix-turn-helix transcriptional regulator [Alphaproteobacteria bacterium GH1-50]|uniref:Winged helix-turn-helix transcriptional regulator n=1 Tax=Kangsaoukella pontilimi TaxID=2691042 RepID=A0A7C9MCX6_9RHOB|nr:winged helix-turn-helix transcriptional regulator [Kangsaoukella pontilimi]
MFRRSFDRKYGIILSETTEALDRTDRKILEVLSGDGRISLTELARRVGLSKTPVQARMKRLEKIGVIRGYAPRIDPVRLGLPHIAFVEVKLADTREVALKAFNDAVARIPEIEECHMIAGAFDYLLKVRTRDMAGYREILGERISNLPHVAQTSTHVAMQAVKDVVLGT